METIYYIILMLTTLMLITTFSIIFFTNENDYLLEIRRLKKIIKSKNKEIKKLKNLNEYIYDNYMRKENKHVWI